MKFIDTAILILSIATRKLRWTIPTPHGPSYIETLRFLDALMKSGKIDKPSRKLNKRQARVASVAFGELEHSFGREAIHSSPSQHKHTRRFADARKHSRVIAAVRRSSGPRSPLHRWSSARIRLVRL